MPDDAVVREINTGIAAYNEQRAGIAQTLKWNLPVFMGIYSVVLLVILGLLFAAKGPGGSIWPFSIAAVAGMFGFGMVHSWTNGPAKRLQQTFRDTFVPKVFGFIDGVAYRQGQTPASYPHVPEAAIGAHNRRSFDDSISGAHKGFQFEVYEATLSQKTGKNTSQVFKGVIMAFRLDKEFPGTLVATKNVGGASKFFRDLFGTGGLVQVESGDAELDRLYEFRSNNADAARHLMSAGFVEALDRLREAWPEQPGRVAISGDNAYVLLPTQRNFFELPKISVACEYKQHIEPMVTDITRLLAIAEEVKQSVDS